MFCRKCGNELRDDDEFCSRCGAKVVRDAEATQQDVKVQEQPTASTPPSASASPIVTAAEQAASEQGQRKRFTFLQSVVRFAICMAALVVCDSVVYTIDSGKASVVEYIMDSRGLMGDLAEACGASLLAILFFLPLLYALARCGYTKRTYAMEAFFVINLLFFTFGPGFGSIMIPVMFVVLIVGVLVRVFAPKTT